MKLYHLKLKSKDEDNSDKGKSNSDERFHRGLEEAVGF